MTERPSDQGHGDKERDSLIYRLHNWCNTDHPRDLVEDAQNLMSEAAEALTARSAGTRIDDKVFRFGADRYEGEQAIHEYCVRASDYDRLLDILNSYVGTYTREKERAEKAEGLLSARSATVACEHIWHGPDQGCRKCGAPMSNPTDRNVTS